MKIRTKVKAGGIWQNRCDSFSNRLRDELLNVDELANLAEARWFARQRRVPQSWSVSVPHRDHVNHPPATAGPSPNRNSNSSRPVSSNAW